MKEKQAVTAVVNNREYKFRYQKAAKKVKSALLGEFTKLTGCHRKSAVRLLSRKPVREVLVCGNGTAVKFKQEKKCPANRKGKRKYTSEVIASLRLVWTFFWYKCGRQTEFDADSRAADEAADEVYRRVSGISHHGGNRRKTGNHTPRVHRPVSQERQGIPQAQRETGNKVATPDPPGFPEKPYPDTDVLHE
jgi:hypothetical protein